MHHVEACLSFFYSVCVFVSLNFSVFICVCVSLPLRLSVSPSLSLFLSLDDHVVLPTVPKIRQIVIQKLSVLKHISTVSTIWVNPVDIIRLKVNRSFRTYAISKQISDLFFFFLYNPNGICILVGINKLPEDTIIKKDPI